MKFFGLICFLAGAVYAASAAAQDAGPESMPFEGGMLTITETPDSDKIVAFDGEEIARNYVAYFDRVVTLGDTNVAMVWVGDGGNQCGPATVIVWKPQGRGVQTQTVGEECGAPPAAATADSLYFVPYLTPGTTGDVQVWSPATGLRTAGTMTFTPQPGTGWDDLDPGKFDNIVQAFDNAEIFKAASDLLGEALGDFATGLLTGGGTETTPDGVVFASGCVPHSCGSADAFMAIDKSARKLYLAQQAEGTSPRTWPDDVAEWPASVVDAMQRALAPQQ